ncbi:O-methyltransferase [Streptomyces afghaniensis]|uniref:O-methyltransferase n=1 Tax=Streptomyces afghaniensis TaxID=66865 RepID=UPI002788B625|nr:class I SAM-dependent methyltransferase [Streptomyces afghaniensis]MDQ1019015.1 putative O-methyltransferase YrrM [Streptomyces afghaniensis]
MTTPATGAARTSLSDPRVTGVLAEIAAAAEHDGDVVRQAYATAAGWDTAPTPMQAAELCSEAALPVAPDVGRFLYQLVRAMRPGLVVEFGTSFGASTIHLAAALRDNGAGRVIGSELHPDKARRARDNLARAGVTEFAEIRVGDALQQLADPPGLVDMVLLDGWKELYLPVLRVLEPALREGAMVVSDNLPMLEPEFLEHVRDAGNGYLSQSLSLGEGIELTLRTA